MRDHEGRRLAKVTRRQNWIPVRLVTFISVADNAAPIRPVARSAAPDLRARRPVVGSGVQRAAETAQRSNFDGPGIAEAIGVDLGPVAAVGRAPELAAGGRVARAGIEMPLCTAKTSTVGLPGSPKPLLTTRVQSPASAGAAAPDLRALRVRVALCRGRWAAPDVPFPAVTDLTLQPGETDEYRSERAFYLPGAYFLEPVQQGMDGAWGGIPPFTCVDLTVSPAR